MRVYLDHAATTPLDPMVLEAMQPYLTQFFGNPSSNHAYGREAKVAVEKARKTIAEILHTTPSEIYFTAGGTEANNLALLGNTEAYGIKNIISSPLEHPSVLAPLAYLAQQKKVKLHDVKLEQEGRIDMEHLHQLFIKYPKSLVSLMHGNHELGHLNPIHKIGQLSQESQCIFHSDGVQTFGHLTYHLEKTPVDLMSASAHKFYGPKGVGFLYVRGGVDLKAQVTGGPQERNMRAGTENVAGIIGMATALQLAQKNLIAQEKKYRALHRHLYEKMRKIPSQVSFHSALPDAPTDSFLPHIIHVGVPISMSLEMLLLNLDMAGIAVSGGSACTSGTTVKSNTTQYLDLPDDHVPLRISLGKNTTLKELDYLITILQKII